MLNKLLQLMNVLLEEMRLRVKGAILVLTETHNKICC